MGVPDAVRVVTFEGISDVEELVALSSVNCGLFTVTVALPFCGELCSKSTFTPMLVLEWLATVTDAELSSHLDSPVVI